MALGGGEPPRPLPPGVAVLSHVPQVDGDVGEVVLERAEQDGGHAPAAVLGGDLDHGDRDELLSPVGARLVPRPTVELVAAVLRRACCRTVTVESIRLDRSAGPRGYLRVSRTVRGERYLLGYCRTVAEVAAHVGLALLGEPGTAGRRRP